MKSIIACLSLCLLLSGCEALPYPRELEDTMLVRVLGVDWTEDGVTLTAADSPENGEAITLLTEEGDDFEESYQELKEAGEEYVSLTHVTQIVVGADSDLRKVLETLLDAREVGQSATVWQAEKGRARELLTQAGGGAKRLTSLELNVQGLEVPTVLEALVELEENGQAALPKLAVEAGVLEVIA